MSTAPATAVSQPSRIPVDAPAVSRWERFSFSVIHGVGGALFKMLGLSGLYAAGRAFGTLEWLINFKRRRRFAVAYQEVCERRPPSGVRLRTGREYFMSSRCDKLFYLIFDWIPRARAETLLTIVHRDRLDAAVARGRGVYVGLAHHGPHHVIGLLIPLWGYKVAGVRDGQEGGIRRFVQERYDRKYPEFQRGRILHSDSFPREIYRSLREGTILGSAMDVSRVRQGHQKCEEVTVFGRSRPYLTGPLWIAVRCRVPILQAFIVPERNFRYRVEILELHADPDTIHDEAAAVSACVHRYAENVEQYARTYPSLLTRV